MPDPKPKETSEDQHSNEPESTAEVLDPNDADRLKNQIRGQTLEHAIPPRLEDEGQSGG